MTYDWIENHIQFSVVRAQLLNHLLLLFLMLASCCFSLLKLRGFSGNCFFGVIDSL